MGIWYYYKFSLCWLLMLSDSSPSFLHSLYHLPFPHRLFQTFTSLFKSPSYYHSSHLQQMNALSTSLRIKSRAKGRFSSVSFFDLCTLIFVYFHSLFFPVLMDVMKWPLTQEFTLKCLLDLTAFCSCHSLLQRTFPIQDWTWVSRIAGRFFTTWATREAPNLVYFTNIGCILVK